MLPFSPTRHKKLGNWVVNVERSLVLAIRNTVVPDPGKANNKQSTLYSCTNNESSSLQYFKEYSSITFKVPVVNSVRYTHVDSDR